MHYNQLYIIVMSTPLQNPRFLSQFVSSQTGMILPRNITSNDYSAQRVVYRHWLCTLNRVVYEETEETGQNH